VVSFKNVSISNIDTSYENFAEVFSSTLSFLDIMVSSISNRLFYLSVSDISFTGVRFENHGKLITNKNLNTDGGAFVESYFTNI